MRPSNFIVRETPDFERETNRMRESEVSEEQ